MTAGAAGPVGFFEQGFAALTGHAPFAWQQRLYAEHFARGHVPPALLTAQQLFVPKSTASLTPIICKAMDRAVLPRYCLAGPSRSLESDEPSRSERKSSCRLN